MEGSALLRWCNANCFKQFVRGPTRGEALLDLIISDVEPSSVEVLVAQVADHNVVLAKFDIAMMEATVVKRIVFDYSKAN